MNRWMFALVVAAGLGLSFGQTASAKGPMGKATGLKCDDCHEKDKKAPSEKQYYKVAKEHIAKGDCKNCHEGSTKAKEPAAP